MALQTIDGPVLLIGDSVSDRPVSPPHEVLFFDKALSQISLFNGSTWSSRESVAIKPTNETRNNNTTLSNDADLVLNVTAGATYILDSQIIYDSGTTPDIKFAWAVDPVSSTLSWTTNALGASASGVNGSLTVGVGVAGDAGVIVAGGVGAGTLVVAAAKGILVGGIVDGAINLRWGQNTADVSNTIVHANSWMRLTRIA